jgi:PilZ domain
MAEFAGVTAPSVLVIDDGELDRVQAVLERMPIDWLRCAEPDSDVVLERPHDLLISSGPRAMKMPALDGSAEPLWVCIYDQDFLPLRERLRDLGVHYLVSGDLAPQGFHLFLRQLLNRGQERRQVRRIPLQCEVQVTAGRERTSARMLELSRESCVISMRAPLAPDQPISLELPAEYLTDGDLSVSGKVIRTNVAKGEGDQSSVIAVLGFDTTDPRTTAHIQALLSGNVLGTLVTPLQEEPGAERAESDAASWLSHHGFEEIEPAPGHVERRGAPRHRYGKRIEAIRWQGESEPVVLLAKDLSLTGMCIAVSPLPPLRSELRLALYGRSREEPVFVRAEVVRRERGEIGLRFLGLDAAQTFGLERLIESSPAVEDLGVSVSARHVVELAR